MRYFTGKIDNRAHTSTSTPALNIPIQAINQKVNDQQMNNYEISY